jgi:nucleoside-diphosphate-sugar epimerase
MACVNISDSRTLIVGCGFVGRQLARELLAAGGSVWGLARTPTELPLGATAIACDITAMANVGDRLPRGLTHVVFAASAGGSSDEQYRSVYVQGTNNVLSTLDRSNLRHMLFVSSTVVYAQEDGEWIDEHAPTHPTQFAGVRMLEAESTVAAAFASTTILRCAGIYGPGRTRLIDSVRQGIATYDPSVPRFTNRIHRDDVAGTLLHIMRHRNPAPVYVGVDEYPAPEREVYEFLAARLGVAGPTPRTTTRESARSSSNKRCSSALLREHGYRFRFPSFREGYTAMLGT